MVIQANKTKDEIRKTKEIVKKLERNQSVTNDDLREEFKEQLDEMRNEQVKQTNQIEEIKGMMSKLLAQNSNKK